MEFDEPLVSLHKDDMWREMAYTFRLPKGSMPSVSDCG